MLRLYESYRDSGRTTKAAKLVEQAVDAYQKSPIATSASYVKFTNQITELYQSRGQFQQAIQTHQDLLALCESELGTEHRGTLTVATRLVSDYRKAGQYDKATSLGEQTVSTYQKVLGVSHPKTLKAMNYLANTCRSAGDMDRATLLYQKTVKARLETLGESHANTLTSMSNLALATFASGDIENALPLFEQVVQLRSRHLGATAESTLKSMTDLAHVYELEGRYEEAKSLIEVVSANKQQLDQWRAIEVESVFGAIMLGLGETDQAATLLNHGYAQLREAAPLISVPHRKDRLARAIRRLIKLAETQEDADLTSKWQQELRDLDTDASMMSAGD